MKNLTDILDGFVVKAKKTEALSDVRFIHAGKTASAEKPVTGFIASCGVGAVQVTESTLGASTCTAQLEFHIYAPENTGSRELSKTTHILMEAIGTADEEGVITSIKASDVVYDSDLCTRKQTVTATVQIVTSENTEPEPQTQVRLYLGGVPLTGVDSFSVTQQTEVYKLKELLRGDTGRQLVLDKKHVIKLSINAIGDPFENAADISLSVCAGDDTKIYADCTVAGVTEKLTSDGVFLREYTLNSYSITQG